MAHVLIRFESVVPMAGGRYGFATHATVSKCKRFLFCQCFGLGSKHDNSNVNSWMNSCRGMLGSIPMHEIRSTDEKGIAIATE